MPIAPGQGCLFAQSRQSIWLFVCRLLTINVDFAHTKSVIFLFMSWKVLGGFLGLIFAGIIGLIVGVGIGHVCDLIAGIVRRTGTTRAKAAFFDITYAVMGHVAKADGRVSVEEIRHADAVMANFRLNAQERKRAQHLFDEGRSHDFDLAAALGDLRRACSSSPSLLFVFLEIQVQTAAADGEISAAEDRLLMQISEYLGLSEAAARAAMAFMGFQASHQGASTYGGYSTDMRVEDAYKMLKLQSNADLGKIKKAYRRLMKENHPDKLIAKGLPEQMVRIATEKTQKIREAYDILQDHHTPAQPSHPH